jgi:DNA-binding NtrC family response regulator
VEITLPLLRERGNDIILLAGHFLRIYEKKYLKSQIRLSDSAQNKLTAYAYPGNVRELQYAIERAVIMSESETLKAEDVVFSPIEQKQPADNPAPTNNLEDLERNAIEKVIEKYNGNISRAAKELGLTRAALYRRLNKYEI